MIWNDFGDPLSGLFAAWQVLWRAWFPWKVNRGFRSLYVFHDPLTFLLVSDLGQNFFLNQNLIRKTEKRPCGHAYSSVHWVSKQVDLFTHAQLVRRIVSIVSTCDVFAWCMPMPTRGLKEYASCRPSQLCRLQNSNLSLMLKSFSVKLPFNLYCTIDICWHVMCSFGLNVWNVSFLNLCLVTITRAVGRWSPLQGLEPLSSSWRTSSLLTEPPSCPLGAWTCRWWG